MLLIVRPCFELDCSMSLVRSRATSSMLSQINKDNQFPALLLVI
uniref:Uncharacterized protein n=1 Tax=Rhizophora mucronata TaxID=61149 RepID=A0A2P2Q902_RHIMU